MYKHLTQAQIDKYAATFETFATNESGVIKTEEFFVIMRCMDLTPTETQRRMVQEIHLKYNGKLDLEKFLLVMRESSRTPDSKDKLSECTHEDKIEQTNTPNVPKASKPFTQKEIDEYTATFDTFDINSYGTLKTQEFFVIMRWLDLRPTEVQLKMLKETDSKFGGKIDLNKFLLLMKENRKLSDSKEELPEHTIEDEMEKTTALKVCKSLTQQEIDEYTTTFEVNSI
ncbi:uncharacterized protein LOC119688200 [Teleopsis dalmanni]|uniref:uncharacterized protein LOC119688200 n=1 Tax=Teleopsis dalmanni TaxID=139649 RepID=UPI0018CD3A45|nr:uncharacterized protein LOC119688200 [Teleopsis dalmanni]